MTRSRDSRRSLYFPKAVLDDIDAEARRQDRSASWLLRVAWRVARDRIAALPSVRNHEAQRFARRHYR